MLLFGSKTWCICLSKVFEPYTIEMEEWKFFSADVCLRKALFFRHGGKRVFTQSSTGAFVSFAFVTSFDFIIQNYTFSGEQ